MDYRALEWIPEQWRVHLRRGDLCIQAGARTSSAASASKAIAVCSLFTAGAAPMDGTQAAMVSFVPQPDIQSACLNKPPSCNAVVHAFALAFPQALLSLRVVAMRVP